MSDKNGTHSEYSPRFRHSRPKVIERDGGKCRFCGMTNEQHREEHTNGLHVHHIVPRKTGGSDRVENLITVCKECHLTLERTHERGIEEIKRSMGDRFKQLEKENERLRMEHGVAVIPGEVANTVVDELERRLLRIPDEPIVPHLQEKLGESDPYSALLLVHMGTIGVPKTLGELENETSISRDAIKKRFDTFVKKGLLEQIRVDKKNARWQPAYFATEKLFNWCGQNTAGKYRNSLGIKKI